MWQEFKEFALKGNAIAVAIGLAAWYMLRKKSK
jgi:large-conductance mechanosensitive channel